MRDYTVSLPSRDEVAVSVEAHVCASRRMVEAMDDGMALAAQACEVTQVKRYAWVTDVCGREVDDVMDYHGWRDSSKRQAPLAQAVVARHCLVSDMRPCGGMIQSVGEVTRHDASASACAALPSHVRPTWHVREACPRRIP